jgi:hypothetical protein
VDPRAGLDDVEKGKLLTLPGLELRPLSRPARSQSSTDYIIPAAKLCMGLGYICLVKAHASITTHLPFLFVPHLFHYIIIQIANIVFRRRYDNMIVEGD